MSDFMIIVLTVVTAVTGAGLVALHWRVSALEEKAK